MKFFNLLIASAVSFLLVTGNASAASHFNVCDNKVEEGEEAEGPFFGLGADLFKYGIAKYHCGANLPEPVEHFQNFSKSNNCGEETEIYKFATVSASLMKSKMKTIPSTHQGIVDFIAKLDGCEKINEAVETEAKRYN